MEKDGPVNEEYHRHVSVFLDFFFFSNGRDAHGLDEKKKKKWIPIELVFSLGEVITSVCCVSFAS